MGKSCGMNTRTLADRLQDIEASPTLALDQAAKALAKAGKPVLNLTAGEPDAPTPEHVKQAGIQAIQSNRTTYTPVAGIAELRSAITTTAQHNCGVAYQPSQVLVSCGAKHSLYNIFQTLCQPGDEVIIFAPYWVSYPPLVRLAGATPILLPTKESDGFMPDVASIRAALTHSTKAIILNSPGNPTGAVIDEARLAEIAALAQTHHLVVVTDEIYDQLVYPPARHVSILRVAPDLADQTVLVGGASKTYSMTGWRIGYALGPQPWIEAMTALQSHSTSNPTSISQYAALAALTGDQQPVVRMRDEFHRRRDRLVHGLNRIPGLRCFLPGGAFYAWCNIAGLGRSAKQVAAEWLEQTYVAVVPGEGFGAADSVRFSFAAPIDVIDQAVQRLSGWATTHS